MKKNALIRGTLLLTAAGLCSRLIGFFYRIFLSRMFGEEGMGIYELINPVLALSFALCTSGIQSAVSKFVASEPENAVRSRFRILLCGLCISGFLSVLCTLFVYQKADLIALSFLKEPRCAPLLRIAALSFPAACIHSCINGYYYGVKKAALPAFCQLFEQCFRVGSVFWFWDCAQKTGVSFSINVASVGLVIGEFASLLAALFASWLHFCRQKYVPGAFPLSMPVIASRLLRFALPLSSTRVCLHLLGAVESTRIPVSLQLAGYSSEKALSIYGVFTGMAMTCILFPGALTNSVSVLLMPLRPLRDPESRRKMRPLLPFDGLLFPAFVFPLRQCLRKAPLPQQPCRAASAHAQLFMPVPLLKHYASLYFKRAWQNRADLPFQYAFPADPDGVRLFRHSGAGHPRILFRDACRTALFDCLLPALPDALSQTPVTGLNLSLPPFSKSLSAAPPLC